MTEIGQPIEEPFIEILPAENPVPESEVVEPEPALVPAGPGLGDEDHE